MENTKDEIYKQEPGTSGGKPPRSPFKKLLKKILRAAVLGLMAFGKTIKRGAQKLGSLIGRGWQALKPGLRKLLGYCAAPFKKLWEKCRPGLTKVWNVIKPPFVFIGKALSPLFKKLAAGFRGLEKPLRIAVSICCGLLVVLALTAMLRTSALKAQAQKNAEAERLAAAQAQSEAANSATLPIAPTIEPTAEPAVTSTPVADPLNGGTLKKGDDSPTLLDIQAALMELGYMDSDEPTEHFGSITAEAVTTFQLHNGLTADGVVGTATYELLLSGGAKEYVMQLGDSGEDVQAVQSRLYELGYLAKNYITGNFGEKTETALKDFQSSNKLTSDGKAGPKTLEKLYDADVVGNFFAKGDTSDTILKYQEKLIKLGYLSSTYTAKGLMDAATVNAIKSFQDSNSLVADGCLGPTTMEAMDSSNANAYTLRLGMSGADVKEVQKRLKELGYLASSSQATGYFGTVTEDAVKAFQSRNGLTADGAVGAKTLAKLESDSARKAKVTATPKPTATPKATAKATAKTTAKATSSVSDTGSSNNSGIEKFISIAKNKIGCKYVRGAKGPNSFDCSGFVYWCLNQAGVKQGYMTSITWRSCTKYTRITSMSSIKRGDVLIFKGSSMASGHVGIYLGDGKMIDASSGAGQVRITSTVLSGSYWKNHFLMAYRIWD